jgi:gliding motility-associated-like protein
MDNGQPEIIAGINSNHYTVNTTGDYAVRYVDSNACYSEYSRIVPVPYYPHPAPPPQIVMPANEYYYGLNYILRIYLPKNDVRYEWYKDGASTGIIGNEYRITNLKTSDISRYAVAAINASPMDCRTLSEEYYLDNVSNRFYIPNVFTPNGDGVNDYFEILGLDFYADNKLEVFDKKGALIYSSSNYANDWDGGKYSTDVYFYVLTLNSHDGNQNTFKGFVHIKRESN